MQSGYQFGGFKAITVVAAIAWRQMGEATFEGSNNCANRNHGTLDLMRCCVAGVESEYRGRCTKN
jgi:hypothetical protein